jgi:hypothetical protein
MSTIGNEQCLGGYLGGSLSSFDGWVRAYVYNVLSNVILCKFVGRSREAIDSAFDESEYGGSSNELIYMVIPGKTSFLIGDDYEIVYLDA